MAASIAELIILCFIADWLFRSFRIPGIIGMLLVGVLLGPHVLGYLDPSLLMIGPDLRMIALIVILLRAGFKLDRMTLHRVGGRVLLLSFIPAICEMLAVTFSAPKLLGVTPMQGALLGTVLAAVSPAVVVPLMIHFINENRGRDKDIPTMVMAATSVDDIFVIVAHTAVVALYVGSQLNLGWQVASIPLSLVTGAIAGLLVGVWLYRFFDRFNPRATKRVLIIIAFAIMMLRLEKMLSGFLPFAGLVSAMAIGFVILEKRETMAHEISAKLAKVWVLAEIILFSMVGAQVDIGVAVNATIPGFVVILLGLSTRGLGVLLCLIGSRLDLKERLFVIFAFSPKATVQAAIGAAPLMAMKAAGMETAPGELILAVAVLSIVVTAPTGAWIISHYGRRILSYPAEKVAAENSLR